MKHTMRKQLMLCVATTLVGSAIALALGTGAASAHPWVDPGAPGPETAPGPGLGAPGVGILPGDPGPGGPLSGIKIFPGPGAGLPGP